MQENIKIKKHYKNKYTTIDNILINDMSLSFQSKGLFLYLWSKPDDWKVNVKQMQHNCIDKQTKIYSALSELEEKGYLIRKRYYINGKVAGINYNLSDTKEYIFDEENLNQENLNQETQNEYIYIQNKDNTKIKTIINKESTNNDFENSKSNTQEKKLINDFDKVYQIQLKKIKQKIIRQDENRTITFENIFNILDDYDKKEIENATFNSEQEKNNKIQKIEEFIDFFNKDLEHWLAIDIENILSFLEIRKLVHQQKVKNTFETIKKPFRQSNLLMINNNLGSFDILIRTIYKSSNVLKEDAEDYNKNILLAREEMKNFKKIRGVRNPYQNYFSNILQNIDATWSYYK